MSTEKSQLNELKKRIPFDKDLFKTNAQWEQVLNDLLNDSKYIALETLFPFDDFSDMDLPKKYENWQLRCCVELYNLADKQGLINYGENSINWSKISDGLSYDLMRKLTPKVGVPK